MIAYDDISISERTQVEMLKYLDIKCQGIPHSLRKTEFDDTHLKVRCPVTGEYITIEGTPAELKSLDKVIEQRGLYRIT